MLTQNPPAEHGKSTLEPAAEKWILTLEKWIGTQLLKTEPGQSLQGVKGQQRRNSGSTNPNPEALLLTGSTQENLAGVEQTTQTVGENNEQRAKVKQAQELQAREMSWNRWQPKWGSVEATESWPPLAQRGNKPKGQNPLRPPRKSRKNNSAEY
jgi:hypothetical protein